MSVRRALLLVAALVALFAISASTALAAEEAGVGVPAPEPSPAPAEPVSPASPPAEPEREPAEPLAPAEPVPTEPAPTGPAPTEPASPEPGPTQPAPSDAAPPASAPPDPMPASTPPASTPPTATGTPGPRPETSPDPEPGRDPTPGGATDEDPPAQSEPEPSAETQEVVAVARNRSLVFQVVWQVQDGCRSHCYATSQSQSAVQWSSTTQAASAVAGSGETSSAQAVSATAEAGNESMTVQFVWQLQIGCVAFCYETSQAQTASQWAETIQTALAEGDLEAWAENLSETLQYVWQLQHGCEHECYGVIQSQTISQGQSTTQSATATARRDTPVTMLVLGPDGAIVLPGWLVALAQNQGATIQTIYQYQEALCREYCEGDVQLQEAIQEALTSQEAIAIAWVGPRPADDPPAEEPPGTEPPVGQPPPAAQPPVQQLTQPAPPAPAASQTATRVRTLSGELPSRRELRRLRMLLSRRSDGTRSASRRGTRSSAAVLPLAGGGAAPASPPAVADVPTASTAVETSARTRREATARSAKRDELPPFDFRLALEPVGGDDSSGWWIVALVLGALAPVGLVARRRLRPVD